MLKKSLFDKNERHTEVGISLDSEVTRLLKPIMRRMVNDGYRAREVGDIMSGVVIELCLTSVLGWWDEE